MGYKTPTSRKSRKKNEKLNLIPILDAVFIFIFFLLMSTQFIKVFEIGSDVPIISNTPPPKNEKKPLALTLRIESKRLVVSTGIPSKTVSVVGKLDEKEYDLEKLHSFLIDLKKKNLKEEVIVLEPVVDLTYEDIVKIMDAVRMFKNTDEAVYRKNKEGIDEKLKTLFSKIIFGNLMS